MRLFYKRLSVIILILIILSTFFTGCKDVPELNELVICDSGLVVNYIDVGNNDCTFIKLPDGKTMLVDAGGNSSKYYESIKEVLDSYKVDTINYLIISNPKTDNVGCVCNLLQDYKVERAFIPNILQQEKYANFNMTVQTLDQMGAQISFSMPLLSLSTSEYKIYFLSPCGENAIQDYYAEFNGSIVHSTNQENNLSPVIYLEYKGVRFLFTADACASQEKLIIKNYKVGLYNTNFADLDLNNIDVLKVGNHGSGLSTCTEFLQLLKPKKLVISVGGTENLGFPSTSTIQLIRDVCPSSSIYRTDVNGTITLNVVSDGNLFTYCN